MKIGKKILKQAVTISEKLREKNLSNFLSNVLISVLLFIYILMRHKYVNEEIPFWYTKSWGDSQLAPKIYLYLIPLMSLAINLLGLFISILNKFYVRYLENIVWYLVLFVNLFLSGSVLRIIRISSVPYDPIVDPLYVSLIPSFIFAFLLMRVLMPYFIDYAKQKKIITNPKIHDHPGMVLKSPSARGGGFVYAIVFLLSAVFFVGFKKELTALYVSILMTAILGIVDDYQNTHPKSSYRALENPFLRLFLLFISVLPVIFSGVMIFTISNPFGGIFDMDIFTLNIGGSIISVIPLVVTSFWVVWLMNVLSWSNGVDGQFPGIVGISSILISLLALRFDEITHFHRQVAILAAISAGASFGSVKFNWHPSKIMWGFGAMSAGLIIAILAIMAQAKIAVSILIILIPFLDAMFSVSRRLLKGKNPLRGDRGHLHHILLDRGWGVNKIALFYWFATAVFGLIGFLSPEWIVLKLTLIIMGIVAFGLVILNISFSFGKKENPPEV
jgi:UDP-GlcNAc:undecaprenyl-phosphate GlcNAc-1-phosphate transferase